MKLNILIVDDRPENLLALETLLKSPDLNVIKATSGNEALTLILKYDFALVLLDVQMPDMDGFETAELMRGLDKTKHIPIIFVTAISKEQKHVFRGYETGAVDYLFKPLDTDILQSKVNVFLELHRRKRALERMNEELKKSNKKIREQQKAVIEEERLKILLQMAGATAYEFEQPLMALLDNIDSMEMSKDKPEKTARYIARIKEAGQQIAATVKKIQTIRYNEAKLHDNVKILSVDDNDNDFQTIRNLLKEQNQINLYRAANIKEALALLEQNRFDVIFLEYLLNDGTAFDFLKNIKKKGIEIPVVVITGHGDEMIASQMIQSGVYDYLPKSKLSIESLSRAVNNTLEKARLKMELKKAQAKMAEMSIMDELTKLSNHRYFMEVLESEFERAKRYKSEMVLVMLDMDHFKKINDTYGHPVGDTVLSEIGKILKESKRHNDQACRYGGEEFAVILPHTNRESAFTVCEGIRKAVAGHVFKYESNQFSVTVSVGIASGNDSKSSKDLLAHADQALYQAKKTGRNKVCTF